MSRLGLTLRLLLLLCIGVLPAIAALYVMSATLTDMRVRRAATVALFDARTISLAVDSEVQQARLLGRIVAESGHCLGGVPAGYVVLGLTPDRGCGAAIDHGIAEQAAAAAASGRPYTVGLFSADPGRPPMLPVFVPAASGQTAIVGVLLPELAARIAALRLPDGAAVVAADADGTLLFRVPGGARGAGQPAWPDGAAEPVTTRPVTRIADREGGETIEGDVPASAGDGIAVAYDIPVPVLVGAVRRETGRAMLAVVASGLLSLVLMTIFARRLIYDPAAALLGMVRRWSAGDRSARAEVDPSATGDFGRLAAAVNEMADTVDARQRQLEQLNATLEARVADRTRALSESNNRLLVEINERARTDAALRRAQKLQAVGQLAGGVAHEFNNLLTTITGALELMRARLPVDPALHRSADTALGAARRGAQLTGQMLGFARQRRLLPIPTDFNALILGLRDLLQGAVGRGATLELELADTLWLALADPHEIEVAIMDLALNAREAMGQGGTLRIATRNVVLPRPGGHATPEGEFVELAIEDDGAGMTEAELAQAVHPFFTTKAPGQGAGLGLSQVHGMVQQLGGDLQIASREGEGTTITLLLPRAQARTGSQQAGAVPCGERCAILLVDDDDQVREIAADMLTALDYEVTQASGGAAALELLRADIGARFCALVVDYAMPGINGLELIERAKALRPDLPPLLITGFMELEQTAGTVLPPAQILRKPFTLRELSARLTEIAAPALKVA
jgi:signal transduction histidine kinase